MATLLIAELVQSKLAPSLVNLVTAAQHLKKPISVILIGHECSSAAEEARKLPGIQDVLLVEDPSYEFPLVESMAFILKEIASSYEYILAPATTFGKNILPRLAAFLDAPQVSDVIKIINGSTFVHPIYASNVLEMVEVLSPQKLLTIRPTAFEGAAFLPSPQADLIKLPPPADQPLGSKFLERMIPESTRPDLSTARVVVSGGRGFQSAENFKLLQEFADCLGAAVGASRAAVDAGFSPNETQVGQTGRVVAPHLYIAVGISGAIQHVAGMKDSKTIVAINKDPEAPIFQIADFGLVGDLFEILPSFIKQLKKI